METPHGIPENNWPATTYVKIHFFWNPTWYTWDARKNWTAYKKLKKFLNNSQICKYWCTHVEIPSGIPEKNWPAYKNLK